MQRLEKLSKQLILQKEQIKDFLYAVPINQKKPGQSQIYRHPQSVKGLLQAPNGINNLADFWDSSVKKFQNHKLIENLSYLQIDQLIKQIGSWFLHNKHSKVYLYCKNSPEWTLTDLAGWNYGIITIPLYDTLGTQAFDHILKLTEGTSLATFTGLLDTLIKNFERQKGSVNTVILFDQPSTISQESVKKIKQLEKMGLKVVNFHQKPMKNKDLLPRPKQTLKSHLTYCFTSGTTGLPKGVINTHENVITQVCAMKGHYEYKSTDIHMSYLPIAHTFERFIMWTCTYYGTNIQYSKFPPTQILKDLAAIKPTTIPIVPRLLNKLYPVMKGLYDKQSDKEVAKKKIKGMFGGRLQKMVTGSAPVAANILTFFKEVLQCDVRQGYGQTETTAASFVTYQGDTNYGHVGGVNKSLQVKLVDVPQMNYTSDSNPPKGQVCTRGPSIFVGYYKNPQNTQETLDTDGWNHSGDVGMILPNGSLKIIDRKKNIFKLSQGQYIAPQKVQNIYVRCKYVAQCFLYGDSMKDYNVAIIHPNLDYLPAVAKSLSINQTDPVKLCNDPKITKFIHDQMNKQAQADGLFGFETAKKIKLWPQSFALYGVFTSTMKLQRAVAKKVFLDQIDKMYASN